MPHQVNRRQKPAWKQVRRPLPPPGKPHSTKKERRATTGRNRPGKRRSPASSPGSYFFLLHRAGKLTIITDSS